MKRVFKAYIDGTEVGKRTSTSRVYTHCVAVMWSKAHDLRTARHPRRMEVDAYNWEYYVLEGGNRKHARSDYLERVDAARTATEFAEAEAVRRETLINSDPKYDEWHVVTWCGRLDLAYKAASSLAAKGHVRSTMILDAVEVAK